MHWFAEAGCFGWVGGDAMSTVVIFVCVCFCDYVDELVFGGFDGWVCYELFEHVVVCLVC